MFAHALLATASIAALLLAANPALANPALTGAWNGTLQGNPISLTLDGKGGGQVDGRPIRYQVLGGMLMVEDQGEVAAYSFQVKGNQLQVAGGQLPGLLTLTRGQPPGAQAAAGKAQAGTTAMAAAAPGLRQELVGKWCKASSFTANAGGGSQSSACFELRGNGTYVYGSERTASAYGSGMWGGTSANQGDAGRWSASEGSITAQSNSGRSTTYRLEKRNHPKNRDPMLCLDGDCYVTFWQKPPW